MTISLPAEAVLAHALIGMRVVAVVFTAPLLSHRAIPRRVRIAMSFALTLGVASSGTGAATSFVEPAALELASMLLQEALIGVAIGVAAGFTFAGFGMMAEFIAIQGGLGAANAIDPTSGISTVVLTSLIQVIGLLVFMAIDGHHQVLLVLMNSFNTLPVGASWSTLTGIFEGVVALGAVIFQVAVSLSAPVVVAMLASNVAVGILGRTIPQLNLIALQLPAHIALTLLLLGLGAGPLTEQMAGYLSGVVTDIGVLVAE
jgi:flagellar biosynthetic protein FliR